MGCCRCISAKGATSRACITSRLQQAGLSSCSGMGWLLQVFRNGQSHHRLLRDKLGGQVTKEEVSWYYLDPQVQLAPASTSGCSHTAPAALKAAIPHMQSPAAALAADSSCSHCLCCNHPLLHTGSQGPFTTAPAEQVVASVDRQPLCLMQGEVQGPCSIAQFRLWIDNLSSTPSLAKEHQQFLSVHVWRVGKLQHCTLPECAVHARPV